MIQSFCYDIEVLPNFFSVTIVDVNDYLRVFKDACTINKKGRRNPIPLVQHYTIAEIKQKLTTIKHKSFYITDTDDSQLLSMIGYLNNMAPHRNENNVAVRTDMFGYNSNNYDKLMIAGLFMYFNQTNNTKELIRKLYELSKHIIDLQNNPELARHDFFLSNVKNYQLPFINVDLMTIFALNKVGKGKDKDGKDIYFPKGLKQTSINLQWYELLEYELPSIDEEEAEIYRKDFRYKGFNLEHLNRVIDKWDRHILPKYIDDMMHYNLNDVFICCEMIRLYMDEIKLRYNISAAYGVDVLSSSRSNIADKLFVKFYSDFSGLTPKEWQGQKTERTALSFNKVIFPFIKFKTTECQELLDELKQTIIYSTSKKGLKEVAHKYPHFKHLKTDTQSGWFEVTMNNLTYTVATGGLHSQDIPRELKSKLIFKDDFKAEFVWNELANNKKASIWDYITDDSYVYVHWDISSFYPSIMDVYKVAPAHLNKGVFVKLIHWLKETRVTAKHSTEEFIDGIPKDILAQVLKIVINSIYGKLGFSFGDLYDRLAVLNVTINGQLMILMLCEELELAGIEVMSANTDGIVVKLHKRDKDKFEQIAQDWKDLTKLDADSEEYKIYVNRDINNYLIQELNGKVSYKGAMHPKMYANDLQKGYDMPIVAEAVANYFLYNKPVLETLYEAKNILDFCKTQNVGKKFHVELQQGVNYIEYQRYVRFYVSNNGNSIFKVDNDSLDRSNLCAGNKVNIINSLDDKRIELRDINYTYYYKEALKIIDPIKLQISANYKGDKVKRYGSGKQILKKYSGMYNSLFDDNEE